MICKYIKFFLLIIFSFIIVNACSNKKKIDSKILEKKLINRVALNADSYRVINLNKISKKNKLTLVSSEYLANEAILWAENKFYSQGESSNGEVILKILDVKIFERVTNKKKGLLDLFYIEPEFELAMKVEISMEFYKKNKKLIGKINSFSKIVFNVSEEISLYDRKKLIGDSKNKLFDALEKSLINEINKKLNNQSFIYTM